VEVTTKKKDESDASPGALFSSGLIAAEACLDCCHRLRVVADAAKPESFLARLPDWLAFGQNTGLCWRQRKTGHADAGAIAARRAQFGLLQRRCFISRGKKLD